MNAPLSPSDVDTITTFYNLYMGNPPVALQGMTTPSARAQVKRQMLQDAAVVLPLLQRQYELARLGDSANGQEALQVKRNLEWVEQRLSEVQG
jgi:hypothetical protein